MASVLYHEVHNFRICIIFLVTLSHMLSDHGLLAAKFAKLPTFIESENGDIIDCVDIYKQPAFSHPLLKNHTLQMKPSSYPRGMKSGKFSVPLSQSWHKNGQYCPEGTIPIARTRIGIPKRAPPFVSNSTRTERNLALFNPPPPPPVHEYAQVSENSGEYFGAHAAISVWNPRTIRGEYSFSQLWILSGLRPELNTIEAGWLVKHGEKQTRFFIYWTKDNYENTGCYDLECPGFVQTNRKFALGAAIQPVSVYGRRPYDIDISIHKDMKSGHWWLKVQNQQLGYWPSSIFLSLARSSNVVSFGGEITNSKPNGHHTSTGMGSGHFSGEGYGKASFFRNLGLVDGSGATRNPIHLVPIVTNPNCYDLQVVGNSKNSFGVHFYYGGPGNTRTCP